MKSHNKEDGSKWLGRIDRIAQINSNYITKGLTYKIEMTKKGYYVLTTIDKSKDIEIKIHYSDKTRISHLPLF